ncbi:MAG: hypothetical protein VKI42_02215, partial [Synechococcaceae cyanobacterium]|nr:hypothetical protein [Synechococcaceae cyanobacterium]
MARLPSLAPLPVPPLDAWLSLDAWLPLLSSMAFWLTASLLVGLLANHLPMTWLERPEGSRGSARPGRAVQRAPSPAPRTPGPPGIRIWKRWIPDAGGALPGGVAKASLVRRDPQSLRRLVLETRRAELVHWLLLPGAVLTALWLPPAGVLLNVLFALAFNLPCLLLQRHNRARL